MILHGDCREVMEGMETGSVQAIFTSPPYWEQRTYGDSTKEIGHGDLQTYLDDLGTVVDQCHRVLDSDGWMGWVIGDKAAGSGGAGGDHGKKGSKAWIQRYGKAGSAGEGIRDGQFVMVPYHFAHMCQRRGWLLRTMVVWDKSPNVKPEDSNHVNRPLISSERIVLLTKAKGRRWRHEYLPPGEAGDVWHVKPHRGAGAARHYAPFPGELARRFILATTEIGMTVLDPFVGSGTTVQVAQSGGMNRVGIGIELYPPGGSR